METIKKFKEKKGIAFIITLGLLAMLMIMGVSFAVYMKVEREAAANFMLVGSTRQLALAGVAYAMDDINFSLDEDPDDDFDLYPVENNAWGDLNDPFHGWFLDPANFTGDDWNDNNKYAYEELVSDVYMKNKLAKMIIPINAFETAKKLYKVNRLKLADIFNDGEFVKATFPGNASYIVINLSGMIDPNFAGGQSRGIGGTPAEFQITELPGVMNVSFPGDWYETMQKISVADGIDAANIKCLYPFSMFTSSAESVNADFKGVMTNVVDYSNQNITILSKMLKDYCDVTTSDTMWGADAVFPTTINLIDYLDNDSLPGGPNEQMGYIGPYVDAFPMINEVYLKTMTAGSTVDDTFTCTMVLDLKTELFYPFIAPKIADVDYDGDLVLEYEITFKKAGSGIPNDFFIEPNDANQNHTVTRTVPVNISDFQSNADPVVKLPNFIIAKGSTTNYLPVTYELTIELDVKLKDNSGIYDGFFPNNKMTFDLELANLGNYPSPKTDEFDYQVIDPRMNYNLDNWVSTSTEDANLDTTLNNINTPTQTEIDKPEKDSDTDMFIRGYKGNTEGDADGVLLESVGELAYIFTGNNWETVRLLDQGINPRHKIYEYLYLAGSGLTNSGCANINTEYTEVLKAALKDMPIVPDGSVTISDTQLDDLVAKIQNLTEDGGISPTNLFSIANQNAIFTALGVDPLTGTEFEKEAFYVSGMPALHFRQNLFAIISKGSYMRSKQICLAIVWRDPVPDEDGRHPCFIRELVWLNGE
ncbi:MAG: hypothetical protein PF692_00715 [Kiritimatiellae bacterium]|jgi:hypothetical protein|nr:hypothetical protein [Kiritimatiellia bacterium]